MGSYVKYAILKEKLYPVKAGNQKYEILLVKLFECMLRSGVQKPQTKRGVTEKPDE
jgi:hypothetical protein